jgi:hypothetical protein
MMAGEPTLETFRSAIQLACRPQNAGRIMAGRQQVLALPRAWVLERIEQVAVEALDLSNYIVYIREYAKTIPTRLAHLRSGAGDARTAHGSG